MFFGRRDIFLLSVFTFLTTAAWVGFDFYHSSIDTTISAEIEAKLAPVTPTFDLDVIERIKTRRKVEPLLSQEGGEEILVSTASAGESTRSGLSQP